MLSHGIFIVKVLSQGISINDLMPAKYALEYLQKNLSELSRKFEGPCSQKFFHYFAQGSGAHLNLR